jgi:hypothetical protein
MKEFWLNWVLHRPLEAAGIIGRWESAKASFREADFPGVSRKTPHLIRYPFVYDCAVMDEGRKRVLGLMTDDTRRT